MLQLLVNDQGTVHCFWVMLFPVSFFLQSDLFWEKKTIRILSIDFMII